MLVPSPRLCFRPAPSHHLSPCRVSCILTCKPGSPWELNLGASVCLLCCLSTKQSVFLRALLVLCRLVPPLLPLGCRALECHVSRHAPFSLQKPRVLAALPFEGSHEGDSHSTFCSDSLHKGDFSSSTCLQVLAQSFVEPLEARRPGVLADSGSANYFVLGAYKCVPRIGVTKLTRQHLSTASFINSFLMQRFPGATWSAFVVTHNEAWFSFLNDCVCNP